MHVPVRMRDGVHLYANVFLPGPAGAAEGGSRTRVPAILVRTPYGKSDILPANYQALVDHGYAVVVEDVRGRYESEGTFQPLTQEPADGNDTIDWIARQPWSDGKVGMTGGSYLGIAQWKAALGNNPHLKAIFPVVSGDDDYRDRFYSTGGAMKLGNRLEWMAENLQVPGYHPDFTRFVMHLPLRTADVAATGRESEMYQEALAHPAFDDFWRGISVKEHMDKVRVPVFAVGGWYDNFVESDLEAYAALHKSSGLEPHSDRTVAAQHVDQVFGRGFRRGFHGPRTRFADRMVRPVADGQGHAAGFRAASEDFRDGVQPVARSARVAARAGARTRFLPGERRLRQ